VELAAVQQPPENAGNLLAHDARAVVLDDHPEARLAELLDADLDFREDARLLAGVQGVVHRLLDRGQQGLAGVVEAEQVAVLGEELADGDAALGLGHRLGRGVGRPRARGLGQVLGLGRRSGFSLRGRGSWRLAGAP